MAILVLSHPLPSAPFVAALQALAPDLPVWTEADTPPPDAVEVLLAWRLTPGVVPRYPNLRVVCSTGAGVDKLLAVPDLPAGLPVTRVVDPQQARTIAQYVVAQTLHAMRDFTRYEAQQARAEWRRHPVRPPAQCRVGLLGQGEVAQAIARAIVPLGLPLALWGRQLRPLPGLEHADVTHYTGEAGLPALLASSDVLVNTLPLTEATRGLLDRARLAQLPAGAWLVNVGRGEHLVEDDLRTLLDSGHLAGAALDVFAREPLPRDHWLWRHPSVRATPHIAGEARFEVVATACLDALQRCRAGQAPQWLVNRSAGY
jgi:phosphoglycerate dehydrogenase-like enzyme